MRWKISVLLLEFKDDYFNAVENVNLSLYQNEVLAIVGESGCGKSTLATTIMGLHNFNFTKVSGEVIFEGKISLIQPKMSTIKSEVEK